MRALGLDTVTLAGAYHAGKFIRPKGKAGKVYFPEDGTVYFRPDPTRYGEIKPLANSLLAERDVLARALPRARDGGERLDGAPAQHAGSAACIPHATVENAFGDRYVYSLCPSAPEVREYAVALCKDVTDNYPVIGVSLETPGFLPYQHGYHHEFALMRQNRWFDAQMGLCFCEHCVARRRRTGASMRQHCRKRIARDIEDLSRRAKSISRTTWRRRSGWRTFGDGELAAFLRYRCEVVTSLVAEIRDAVRDDATVAVIPSVARPTAGAWYEGTRPCRARQGRWDRSKRASTSRASRAFAPTSST